MNKDKSIQKLLSDIDKLEKNKSQLLEEISVIKSHFLQKSEELESSEKKLQDKEIEYADL